MDSQNDSSSVPVGVTQDTPQGDPADTVNVQVWLNRIAKARQKEQSWRSRAERVVKIYRDDNTITTTASTSSGSSGSENTFNILWANTETLLPALFSSTPKPDVRNRYLNQDKVAEKAGDVIERCLSYSLDLYDFSKRIKAAIKDYLLTGRCVVRVRLIPKFETKDSQSMDDTGNPVQTSEEVFVGQEVECELVPWDSFIIEPAKRWEDVTWVGFIHMLSKDQFEEYFPDAPLISAAKAEDRQQYSVDPEYQVYEVWDKKEKKVYFIGQADKPLKVTDDPLKLEHFWPIAEPLYSIQTNDTLVPIPEYTIYQSQAYELNQISYRITDLIKSCKMIGVYDAQLTEMQNLLTARDSQFVPVTSNLLRQGGISTVIDILDTTRISAVLAQLYTQRDQAKSIIYEVTGISDIIRGEGHASESATAQSIKAQYAGLRLRDRRDNIDRFVVSLLRIKTEMIATFFTTKQLEEMSGIKLDYSNEQMPPPPQMGFNGMVDPMAMQAYQAAMQQAMADKQESEQVLQYIRSDVLRNYKIDIETDSTILADMDHQAQKSAQIVSSITQFITATAPLVAQGALPLETAKALLKFGLQAAKIPRELEDALELIGTHPQQPMMPGMPPQGMPMGMPPGAHPGMPPGAPQMPANMPLQPGQAQMPPSLQPGPPMPIGHP